MQNRYLLALAIVYFSIRLAFAKRARRRNPCLRTLAAYARASSALYFARYPNVI